MAFRIDSADFSDVITSADDSGIFTFSNDLQRVNLPASKGEIIYNEQTLGKHLSIFQCNYALEEDVTVWGKGEFPLLEMRFNLSDKAIFYKNKVKKELVAPGRSGNISFLSSEENQAEILFQKNVRYSTFDIHLPLWLLNQYEGESKTLDAFLNSIQRAVSSNLLAENTTISPGIYSAIDDIRKCTFEGLNRRIYLESKVYELIALICAGSDKQQQEHGISHRDRERILWAASLIQENLNHSFTIFEIARTVGINQTKLKTGFKNVFGHTVFGYLQEIRMTQAKKYILDTKLSIHEIGLLLGYQNTSNFSIAFKKVQGISPNKLRPKSY